MTRAAHLGQLLTRAALAYVRVDRLLSGGLQRSRAMAGAFLSESLSTSERASLALRIYGQRTSYGPPGLFAWERSWYERDLPPPPARIVVGGCGSGREVRALLSAGYEVSGFEPVASLCSAARRELGARAWIGQFGYEDSIGGVLRSELSDRGPYDAIILGWTSFSHVLDRSARECALRVLAELCPAGPLLISFHAWRPADFTPPASTFEVRARRVGRRVCQLRGLPAADAERDAFVPTAGFIHRFSEGELSDLAGLVERELRWGDDQRLCGHVSFFPVTSDNLRPSTAKPG